MIILCVLLYLCVRTLFTLKLFLPYPWLVKIGITSWACEILWSFAASDTRGVQIMYNCSFLQKAVNFIGLESF